MLRFLKRAYWPFTWDSSGGPDHAGASRQPPLKGCTGNRDNKKKSHASLHFQGCSKPADWCLEVCSCASCVSAQAIAARCVGHLILQMAEVLEACAPANDGTGEALARNACSRTISRACKAGGFTDAALVALEGAASAELQAVSAAAAHRLNRGIWTSPGAGDLRRAVRRLSVCWRSQQQLLLTRRSISSCPLLDKHSQCLFLTVRQRAVGRAGEICMLCRCDS